jgi:hypothetical protein
MAGLVTPVFAWIANVSHRKAPGAISAIALLVRLVSPRVDFIWPLGFSAMLFLLFFGGD